MTKNATNNDNAKVIFFSRINELAKCIAHPIYLNDYASAHKNPPPVGFQILTK